ncbi:MAG: hypothetical protein K2X82_16015 [Gemmataceae bacterium]|nr:hypothetical protein [Gemmataceae bacterium]
MKSLLASFVLGLLPPPATPVEVPELLNRRTIEYLLEEEPGFTMSHGAGTRVICVYLFSRWTIDYTAGGKVVSAQRRR